MTQNDEFAEVRVHSGAGIRTELRDLETGLKNGWAIPPETLAAVPERMLEFVENGTRREAIAAARVLASLLKHNAELEPATSLHLHQHQTAAAAEAETPDEPFDVERTLRKNLARIERLRRLGGFDDCD